MIDNPFKKAVDKAKQKAEKIKENLSPDEIDALIAEQTPRNVTPNRAKRRERSSKRFWQKRTLPAGAVRKDRKARWEWKPTQRHPMVKRTENRRRNKVARASRKANRRLRRSTVSPSRTTSGGT